MTESQPQAQSSTDGVFVRRLLIIVIVGSVMGFVGLVLINAFDVLLVLFAGVLFATFLVGLSRALSTHSSLPYGASLTAVALGLFASLVCAILYLVPTISNKLIALTDELTQATQDLYQRLNENPIASEFIPDTEAEANAWLPSDFNIVTAIGGIFSTAAGAITAMIIILFVGLYLAVQPELYQRGVLRLFPVSRRERIRHILHAAGDTLWWWILGRLASMAIIGVFTGLGLWLLGIPMPIALGILAALLTFIPNVGPLLALIPPTLLALKEGPMLALGVVAFYLFIQLIESYLITPLIEQRSIALPPVVTLGSQLILGYFTGIIGLAMATPLTALVLVLIRELYVKDVLEANQARGFIPPTPP